MHEKMTPRAVADLEIAGGMIFQEDQNNRRRCGHRTTETEKRRRSYVVGWGGSEREGVGDGVALGPLQKGGSGVSPQRKLLNFVLQMCFIAHYKWSQQCCDDCLALVRHVAIPANEGINLDIPHRIRP